MDYRTPSVCPLDGEPCLGYAEALMKRDALAAENERLRAFAQWVAAGEPSPAEYDPSADGRDEALSSGNSGDSELYGVLTVYYNMAQKAKAALSLQPPTVSPSAPAVSGDRPQSAGYYASVLEKAAAQMGALVTELERLRRVAEAAKRIGLVIDTIPALDAALAEWEAVNE